MGLAPVIMGDELSMKNKLLKYLEVSIILPIIAAEKYPPLDAKSSGQLLKSNLEI